MTEIRLSVNLYLTNAALVTAAIVRGSQRRVAPRSTLAARSPLWGGDSKCSSSPEKLYLGFAAFPSGVFSARLMRQCRS